jgi:outer membrane protein assembly factor BamB
MELTGFGKSWASPKGMPPATHSRSARLSDSGIRRALAKWPCWGLADAKGDITGTPAVVWTLERDTPYVPSPLVYDGILYVLKGNTGILSVFDAKTGTPHYALQRLEATPNVFASPVGAAGRVYIAGREGTTVVLKNGPAFEQLAANRLDDGFDASPALVDGEIYLRGTRYLYCIAEK